MYLCDGLLQHFGDLDNECMPNADFGLLGLKVFVDDAAGEEAVPLISHAPLVDHEPGDEPGALQDIDGDDGDGAADAVYPETRQSLQNARALKVPFVTVRVDLFTVTAPTPKANASVKEVTVIATPACFRVNPMRSSRLKLPVATSFFKFRFFQH